MGMEQSAIAVVTYRHMLFGIYGQTEKWSFGYRVSTCVGHASKGWLPSARNNGEQGRNFVYQNKK